MDNAFGWDPQNQAWPFRGFSSVVQYIVRNIFLYFDLSLAVFLSTFPPFLFKSFLRQSKAIGTYSSWTFIMIKKKSIEERNYKKENHSLIYQY